MKRFAFVPLLLALAACSGQETPRTAEFIADQPAHSDFGNLRVRYSAIPTLSLNEETARHYEVERNADSGLLVVALRKTDSGEEQPIEGSVKAIVRDLDERAQHLDLRPVRTGDYVDYIATFRPHPRDTFRFDITVHANGQDHNIQFQRNY
ncbi:MAG: DUF4426 domain-containing protein [Xanthomonadaceae bacterium]|jgi:hypothetical protein|nr:DUF4426 domain-containing protein [Xanthomonadaceae bacterium]